MTGLQQAIGLSVRATRLLLAALGISLLAGCATPSSDDTLYQSLGGIDGITRITDNFLYHIGEDDRVIEFFAATDIDRFHSKIIEHLCEISGGPCVYTGDPMSETHQGMAIGEVHFNAIVEDLIKAMDDENIPTRAQNQLLQRLAALHGEITGR